MKLSEKFNGEITIEDLADIHPSLYELIDIRDSISHEYGCIPHSISDNQMIEKADKNQLDKDKTYVLYCMHGRDSMMEAEYLRSKGYDALDLVGGYASYLANNFKNVDEDKKKEVERSIFKTYRRELLSPFLRALDRYDLIQEGDKIAVCISGGKDSMLMAKLFQEIQPYSKVKFETVFLVMDPGYSELNRLVIEQNAKMLGVPIEIFNTRIFDAVDNVDKSPCYLCARMRRGHLYNKAKELGCNKIALGHHYDDVIETIMMSLLYAGQFQTMMPKLKSDNFEGMELIRPMYLIRENDIKKWRDYNNLHFIQCACHFTDTCSSCREDGSTASKRMEMKNLIAQLQKTNRFAEANIFKSAENVCLDAIVAYKKDKVKHSFLDDYNTSKKKDND